MVYWVRQKKSFYTLQHNYIINTLFKLFINLFLNQVCAVLVDTIFRIELLFHQCKTFGISERKTETSDFRRSLLKSSLLH